jgi:hypothetical protein
MSQLLKAVDVYGLLRERIAAAGSQRAYATRVGISPQFLSDVLMARSEPSAAILADLGLQRVVRYIRKDTVNAG